MLAGLKVTGKNLLLVNPPAAPAALVKPRKPAKPRGAKQRANYSEALKQYAAGMKQYHLDAKADAAVRAQYNQAFQQQFENISLSCRNLPGASITRPDDLNTYQILNNGRLIVSEGSLQRIKELWG